jgi:hypothetical protein
VGRADHRQLRHRRRDLPAEAADADRGGDGNRLALGQNIRAALYIYADTGAVPAAFDGWMLKDAFKPKKQEPAF